MSTLAEDAAALGELKRRAAELEAAAKDVKAERDEAEIALFERMEKEGVGGIRLEGVGNFVRAETQYGQVQDQSEFEKWCQENDRTDMLELKPRKKLINELVRECLDSNQPLPPGIGFYTDTYVSQRAA